jgi:hypothetical protein
VECGCPIKYPDAIAAAVYFDHVEILEWTRSTEAVTWDYALLQRSFEQAGRAGSVGAAAWLRGQGARWPDSFITVDTSPNIHFGNKYWMASTVQWAVANGCTWGDWQCQQLGLEYIFGKTGMFGCGLEVLNSKQCDQTVYELFVWAHENGCPCTCEDPAAAAAALAESAAKVAASVAALRVRSASQMQ